MNYRHAFHAGNHADVLKHVALVRTLDYLRQKDKPFAVLDAHAGIGRYDLKGAEAFKTGEWKDGIGKLLSQPLPDTVKPLLAPYMNMIHDLNPDGALRHYPGSPEIVARMLRRGDRMVFNELHPQDADMLAARYATDRRVRVTRFDASVAVKAELEKVLHALEEAGRKQIRFAFLLELGNSTSGRVWEIRQGSIS